jgi:hypothetical protein
MWVNGQIENVKQTFAMPIFLYRCPVRAIHTHAWIADNVHAQAGKEEFVAIPWWSVSKPT